jgi:FkbM family methyltransferase
MVGRGELGEILRDVKLDKTAAMMDLNSTDIGHQFLFFCGFYERAVTECIEWLREERGGLLVDVGANYGYFTILWCAGRRSNSAIAFEPSPEVYARLNDNIAKNRLTNVRTLQVALGAESRRVPFHVGDWPLQTGWGGIALKNEESTIEVDCRSLDELLQDRAVEISVLKIDTEGADALVLQGCSGLLRRKAIHHILFEENTKRMAGLGIAPQTAQRTLSRFRYHVQHLEGSDWYARPS